MAVVVAEVVVVVVVVYSSSTVTEVTLSVVTVVTDLLFHTLAMVAAVALGTWGVTLACSSSAWVNSACTLPA